MSIYVQKSFWMKTEPVKHFHTKRVCHCFDAHSRPWPLRQEQVYDTSKHLSKTLYDWTRSTVYSTESICVLVLLGCYCSETKRQVIKLSSSRVLGSSIVDSMSKNPSVSDNLTTRLNENKNCIDFSFWLFPLVLQSSASVSTQPSLFNFNITIFTPSNT